MEQCRVHRVRHCSTGTGGCAVSYVLIETHFKYLYSINYDIIINIYNVDTIHLAYIAYIINDICNVIIAGNKRQG